MAQQRLPLWQRLVITVLVMLGASYLAALLWNAVLGFALPSYLAGLVGGAFLAIALIRRPEVQVTSNLWLLLAGGLIVGFGTRWGSGCTSGHGVCGLARLSPRSMVATGVFMGVAGLTVFVTRHVLGGLG